MVDIADTLAADFVQARGWCCVLIAPQTLTAKTLRPSATIVTIDGVRARNEPGSRIWLSRQHADRVVAAFLSRDQRARRRPRGEGLIVDASVAAVDQAVRSIADSLGIALVGDEFVDGQLAMFTSRIEAAMARMKRDGSMKLLNREYAAVRASGAPLPGFTDWLAARLRPAFQAGA